MPDEPRETEILSEAAISPAASAMPPALRELFGDHVFVTSLMIQRAFAGRDDGVEVSWSYDYEMGGPMIAHLVADGHRYRIEVSHEGERE